MAFGARRLRRAPGIHDVDMAPVSVTFGSLLLMGQPTSQLSIPFLSIRFLSIRFLSTFRYTSPVPQRAPRGVS